MQNHHSLGFCLNTMNDLHLRYIVATATLGSLTKASQELMIAQPNLSRIIQGMEETLGISLFIRSSKGVRLTPEGKRFVDKAQAVLADIDDLEKMFADSPSVQQLFSVSVPGGTYLTEAFARFSAGMTEGCEFTCLVRTTTEAIQDLAENRCHLGIIRYPFREEQHIRALLEEKHLSKELVADFVCSVLVSCDSPLAGRRSISLKELDALIEISGTESACSETKDDAVPHRQRMFVSDRAAQFDVLQHNSRAYLWSSPVPQEVLTPFHLVQLTCSDNPEVYRDMLIYRSDYRLTALDKQFITEVVQSKRRAMPS